jgi:hypothetical protein
MARSVEFYRKLGFEVVYGGERAGFTSLRAGEAFVNLVASAKSSTAQSANGRRKFGASTLLLVVSGRREKVRAEGNGVDTPLPQQVSP